MDGEIDRGFEIGFDRVLILILDLIGVLILILDLIGVLILLFCPILSVSPFPHLL